MIIIAYDTNGNVQMKISVVIMQIQSPTPYLPKASKNRKRQVF